MLRKCCFGFLAMTIMVGLLGVPTNGHCEERDYRETGVVITGSYSWKPYSFRDANGSPAGFYIDFWNKWSEKTGVPVSFELVTWEESIEMIARGEADIQSGLYFTKERNKRFDYSSPVYHSRAVVFVGKNTSCNDDLSQQRWGGVTGTEERASISVRHPDVEVVDFTDSIELLKAVGNGEVGAAVDDWSTVVMFGREMGLSDTLKVCQTVYQRDLRAIVLKGSAELLQTIDDGISQITEEERRYLVNSWFIGQSSETGWLDSVMPVVVVVLLSLGVWLWSFRRRGR